MSRCATTSGRYRCKKELGHAGQCESEDEATFSFGPYRDSYRGRAYLRGVLSASSGQALDDIGDKIGVRRGLAETDEDYRQKIWGKR